MTREIERKFLVPEVPDAATLGDGLRLRQGYVAEEGEVEVRVRIAGPVAVVTIKAGRGRSRVEVETPITLEAAEALWPYTEGRRIEKVRHRVRADDTAVDIDVYGGQLDGLCTAEAEFATEDDAAAFEPPPWLGEELTGRVEWTNAALARAGRPPGAG